MIIHTDVTREPAKFHDGANATGAYFALHAAPEVNDKSEEDAREEIVTFLEAAPSMNVALIAIVYTVDAGSGKLNFLSADALNVYQAAQSSSGTTPAHLVSWLKKRREKSGNSRFWAGLGSTLGADVEMEAGAAGATELLRASLNWPAPVPQTLGLTKLIVSSEIGAMAHPWTVDSPDWSSGDKIPETMAEWQTLKAKSVTRYALVPFSGDQDKAKITSFDVEFLSNKPKDLKVSFEDERLGPVSCVTTFLEMESLPDGKTGADSMFHANGTIAHADTDPELERLQARILEGAATQLWVLPVLSDLEKPSYGSGPYGGGKEDFDAAWIARACFISAFDPFFGAMLVSLPGQATPQFRARLVGNLSAAVANAINDAGKQTVPAEKIATSAHDLLVKVLTQTQQKKSGMAFLWALLAYGDQAGDPDSAEMRYPRLSKLLVVDEREQFGVSDYEPAIAEIGALATALENESGIERLILNTMRIAYGDDGAKLAAKLGDSELQPQVRVGLQTFQSFLDDGINAAVVMRSDFARMVLQRLVASSATTGPAPLGPQILRNTLRSTNWFVNRLSVEGSPSAAALEPLRAQLPEVEEPPDDLANRLSGIMAVSFEKAVLELTDDRRYAENFRPDPAPQPLSLRIAPSFDLDILDQVNRRIIGFGIVIEVRPPGQNSPEVAHASLVSIEDSGSGDEVSKVAVLPMLPVVNDGTTAMFVRYDGVPVNGVYQPGTLRGGAVLDSQQLREQEAAAKFLTYDNADLTVVQDVGALAPLIYGFQYVGWAFWVPNSGALPKSLRANTSAFRPKNPKAANHGLQTYFRRTAISQVTISDTTAQPRIGVVPKGVFPLSSDYPRLVISRRGEIATTVNLFRSADGNGRHWESDEVLVLRDLQFSAGAKLTVEIFGQDPRVVEFELDDGAPAVRFPRGVRSWIRLSLPVGTDGTISFADPVPELRQSGRDGGPPICLVARDDDTGAAGATTWRQEVLGEVSAVVGPPGVSFADLECWAGNPELAKRMIGAAGKGPDLIDGLRVARDYFEQTNEPMADRYNQLPDPAVEALFVTLELTDVIDGGWPETRFASRVIGIKPYTTAARAIRSLDDLDVDDADTLLTEIVNAARVGITIKAGEAFGLEERTENGARTVVATLPPGQSARLRVAPMVRTDLFEDAGSTEGSTRVIKSEIRRMAQGMIQVQGKSWHVFPSTALAVEAMQGLGGTEFDGAPFKVLPSGSAREYALEFDPDRETAYWRHFAQVDVITQRWRPSGRPIYAWVDPRNQAQDPESPVVEMQIKNADDVRDDPVYRFEEDAFFDRLADDAERKRVRLVLPPEGGAQIGKFSWSSLSATWRRHRYRVRSRYQGAIRSGRRSLAGPQPGGWTNRVAILADISRAQLTRPQVRAFLPILGRVAGDGPGVTPPITCVLSERPFDQMGLADRVVAGFETVHRYGFFAEQTDQAPATAPPVLGLDALRREIGPDPRTSYVSIADEASLDCRLLVEGPVGLHFERASAASPAFVNSQFLLHVDTASERADLEESFAGVTLRRYADPGWSWVAPAGGVTANSDCWWLDFSERSLTVGVDGIMLELVHSLPRETQPDPTGDQVDMSALRISRVQDGESPGLKVEISGAAAYDSNGRDWVTLARLDPERDYAILYKSLGENRHSISLFVHPSAGDGSLNGRIDRPQMLAATVYRAEGRRSLRSDRESLPLKATLTSDGTFREWVRTARDVSAFHIRQRDADIDQRVDVSAIDAVVRSGGEIGFSTPDAPQQPVRLSSPASARPYPLNLRRHTVLFLQRPSHARGREVGLFLGAVLGDGNGNARFDGVEPEPGWHIKIAELETRAEVLLNKDATSGVTVREKQFTVARFDLAGSGLPRDGGLQQLRFDFRLCSGEFSGGTLELAFQTSQSATPSGQSWTVAFPVKAGSDKVTVVLAIGEKAVEWHSGAFQAGDLGSAEPDKSGVVEDGGELSKALRTVDALYMTATLGSSEPHWMDVSLLHSTRKVGNNPLHTAFDPDWLFSAPTAESDVHEAVRPERLNRLPEVQARLIGLSPDMALREST